MKTGEFVQAMTLKSNIGIFVDGHNNNKPFDIYNVDEGSAICNPDYVLITSGDLDGYIAELEAEGKQCAKDYIKYYNLFLSEAKTVRNFKKALELLYDDYETINCKLNKAGVFTVLPDINNFIQEAEVSDERH
jgi:hypothetical protein